MLWFKKKKRVDDEDLTLAERVRKLEIQNNRLNSEILDLITAQDIIRNKVLRKIQVKKTEEEEERDTWGGIPITK